MTSSHDPKQNQLLAALPDADWQRWQPQLDSVELTLGQVLYESGSTLSHVYFPTTAIVSLLYVLENGASAEIAVAGTLHDGAAGCRFTPHEERNPDQAFVADHGDFS